MPFRSDVRIAWHVNPRVITVLAPSIEIGPQDLVDTLRELESQQHNIIYPSLLLAFGKVPLGGGLFTVITVQLLDAILAFEARDGPDYVQCFFRGGNLVSFDTVADGFRASPFLGTAFTQINYAAATTGAIIQAEPQLLREPSELIVGVVDEFEDVVGIVSEVEDILGVVEEVESEIEDVVGSVQDAEDVIGYVDEAEDVIGLMEECD